MTFTAPKLIAGFITALWGFASLLGAQSALSEQPSPVPVARDYMIEPTTSTSSTLFIDPYATPAAQFAALGVNLGWPVDQYNILARIIERESNGIPNAWNKKDPMGGSYGLLQINGFWCRDKNSYLQGLGIVNDCQMLLDPQTNLRAGLIIWNRSGWNPWGTK